MEIQHTQGGSGVARYRFSSWALAAVVLALLVGGLWHLVSADKERRASYVLWERASQLIDDSGASATRTTVSNLFGNDVDGICVFANGFPGYITRNDLSKLPPPFLVALQRNSRKLLKQSEMGFWFIYSIRSERIVETYKAPFSGHIFVWSMDKKIDGDVHACFRKNDTLRLEMMNGPEGLKLGIGLTSMGYEIWKQGTGEQHAN
jgi:hypothetical protein